MGLSDKIKKWGLEEVYAHKHYDLFGFCQPEKSMLENLFQKIDNTMCTAISIKLEEMGYEFKNKEDMLSFLKDNAVMEHQAMPGVLINKRVSFRLKKSNKLIVCFEITTSHESDNPLAALEVTIKTV